MKNLTHLHVKKVKLYSLFILNKILLKIIILHYYYSFLIKQIYKDVNILMFLTYTKIVYILIKIYIIYDFIIIILFMFY